jgi:putative transposase
MAGWIHRRQHLAIARLQAENRVLRERLGSGRLRFTDAERRLLAEKGEGLSRTMLAELATLATPETILHWYRRMVAAKYDGSETRRSPGPRSRLLGLRRMDLDPRWHATLAGQAAAAIGTARRRR